jgi:vancomycin resistance protein YoaR
MPEIKVPASRQTFEVRTAGAARSTDAAAQSPASGAPTADPAAPAGPQPEAPARPQPRAPSAPPPVPPIAAPDRPAYGPTAERGDRATTGPAERQGTAYGPAAEGGDRPPGAAPADRPVYGPADGEAPAERPRHMRSARAARAAGAGPASDAPSTDEHRQGGPLGRLRLPLGWGTQRQRLYALVAAVPVVLLVLLIVAWAVDTTVLSGQVLRNVDLAGQDISGKGEDALPEVISALAEELAVHPVTIRMQVPTAQGGASAGQTEERTYSTIAGDLGLTVDEDATVQAALDEGRGDSFFVRPFHWLASFFSSREVPVRYTVNELQTVATLQALQGADLTAASEPTIRLENGNFVPQEGRAGLGIDADEVVDALPDAAVAAESMSTDDPIVLDVEQTPIEPRFTVEDAQALADRANGMTAQGFTVQVDTANLPLSTEQLRSWITPTVTDSGLDLMFNGQAVKDTVGQMVAALVEPQNASVTLENGQPVVIPGRNGIALRNDDADVRVWDAMNHGETSVALEAQAAEPEFSTEEVQAWGIAQAIGGNRGWRNGAAIDGPAPGFTTYHNAGEARVTNIHRIADLVRGAVIPPGGTFSVNDHVGRRTTANGFVEAGAIRNGVHVPEVGGGVSQFGTTLFNAAYFAGLDILEYQSHSEWFTRYPRGREATLGYPHPDVVIQNNTPYGVMIWTSYTGSSLTVTMYSTPYATAEQTGITESPQGQCMVVTTTRTRTYPNGETDNDTFRSTYRPGENLNCEGQPISSTTTTAP